MKKMLCSAMMALGMTAAPAEAAVTVVFQQVGSDVVTTLTGTLDLSGTVPTTNYQSAADGGAVPSSAVLSIGGRAAPQTRYAGITGPASYGTGGTIFANVTTGDSVFLDVNDALYLPSAYLSGGLLNASMTFNNISLSAFGITQATVYRLTSGDTITVSAAVPEPATWALMLVGFGMVAGAARFRRRGTRVRFA